MPPPEAPGGMTPGLGRRGRAGRVRCRPAYRAVCGSRSARRRSRSGIARRDEMFPLAIEVAVRAGTVTRIGSKAALRGRLQRGNRDEVAPKGWACPAVSERPPHRAPQESRASKMQWHSCAIRSAAGVKSRKIRAGQAGCATGFCQWKTRVGGMFNASIWICG